MTKTDGPDGLRATPQYLVFLPKHKSVNCISDSGFSLWLKAFPENKIKYLDKLWNHAFFDWEYEASELKRFIQNHIWFIWSYLNPDEQDVNISLFSALLSLSFAPFCHYKSNSFLISCHQIHQYQAVSILQSLSELISTACRDTTFDTRTHRRYSTSITEYITNCIDSCQWFSPL